MTAPASLYQQEMAKRPHVRLARATGCPRRRIEQPTVALFRPRSEQNVAKRENARLARNAEWRKLYEVDGLTLTGIAEQYGCSTEGVRSALRKMGVLMRRQGGGRTMAELIAENKRQAHELAAMRGRILSLRHKLSQYEPEAA